MPLEDTLDDMCIRVADKCSFIAYVKIARLAFNNKEYKTASILVEGAERIYLQLEKRKK